VEQETKKEIIVMSVILSYILKKSLKNLRNRAVYITLVLLS